MMMGAVVPAAKTTATPITIAVFAFVHAIIFNAPLMRVKVEVEAAECAAARPAVLAEAANPAGAACDESAKSGAPAESAGVAKPWRRKKSVSCSRQRLTRLRAVDRK